MGHTSSPTATKINSAGFRKWYEYELIRAFGFLGLGVLCLVASMASLEDILETRFDLEQAPKYILSFLALVIAGWSWYRFLNILMTAEHVSKQAVCPGCKRYGLFTVTDERSTPDQSERLLSVTCKKCGHGWRLGYPLESKHGSR